MSALAGYNDQRRGLVMWWRWCSVVRLWLDANGQRQSVGWRVQVAMRDALSRVPV